MTGYDLADEIFDNIGKDKNHNISLNIWKNIIMR